MIALVVVLVLVGLVLWAVAQLPLDPMVMNLIRVVVLIACVLYVLSAFGLWHAGLPAHFQGHW